MEVVNVDVDVAVWIGAVAQGVVYKGRGFLRMSSFYLHPFLYTWQRLFIHLFLQLDCSQAAVNFSILEAYLSYKSNLSNSPLPKSP